MGNLHNAVYHIVLDPQLLVDVRQNSQPFAEKFNLSAGEVCALLTFFTENITLHSLLSPETLKNATHKIIENIWVPPA